MLLRTFSFKSCLVSVCEAQIGICKKTEYNLWNILITYLDFVSNLLPRCFPTYEADTLKLLLAWLFLSIRRRLTHWTRLQDIGLVPVWSWESSRRIVRSGSSSMKIKASRYFSVYLILIGAFEQIKLRFSFSLSATLVFLKKKTFFILPTELRTSLEEHQSALELIMTKYREQVFRLLMTSKRDDPAIVTQLKEQHTTVRHLYLLKGIFIL